jgi:hypothetical protein
MAGHGSVTGVIARHADGRFLSSTPGGEALHLRSVPRAATDTARPERSTAATSTRSTAGPLVRR